MTESDCQTTERSLFCHTRLILDTILHPSLTGMKLLVDAPECFFMESSKLNQFTTD